MSEMATTTAISIESTTISTKTIATTKPSPKPPPIYSPPTYTMKDIYDAIPAHCFHRSSLLSLSYIVYDALMALSFLYLALQIPSLPISPVAGNVLYLIYTFMQGLVFTGLWELAHESGHFALSTRKWVNYAFGLTLHSFLFVPFHSWRITHSFHHKVTNNLDRDIAFVPDRKDTWMAKRAARMTFLEHLSPILHTIFDTCQDTPIAALLFLMIHQVVAWPTYLILNNFALERMAKVEWWKRSHFYFGKDSPNFKPGHMWDIIVSDLGILVAAGILWNAVDRWGAWNVFLYYGVPWLWTNHWICKFAVSFLSISFFGARKVSSWMVFESWFVEGVWDFFYMANYVTFNWYGVSTRRSLVCNGLSRRANLTSSTKIFIFTPIFAPISTHSSPKAYLTHLL